MIEQDEYKIGPFLCEWCKTPLTDARGIDAEGSVIRVVGFCQKCNSVLWSGDVCLPLPLNKDSENDKNTR